MSFVHQASKQTSKKVFKLSTKSVRNPSNTPNNKNILKHVNSFHKNALNSIIISPSIERSYLTCTQYALKASPQRFQSFKSNFQSFKSFQSTIQLSHFQTLSQLELNYIIQTIPRYYSKKTLPNGIINGNQNILSSNSTLNSPNTTNSIPNGASTSTISKTFEENVIKPRNRDRKSAMQNIPSLEPFKCRILIVGLGGAGGNIVDNFIRSESFNDSIEMLVINTDAQALEKSLCPNKLQIGKEACRGLGAGGVPSKGRKAAQESLEEVMDVIEGVDSVFLLAGLGGGSGTGSLSVLANECRNRGILTIAVVTTPFQCEGTRRQKIAQEALTDIEKSVDSLIIVQNENIMKVTNSQTSVTEAFQMADDVLLRGVKSVTDIVNEPGLINLDFADIYTVFRDGLHTYMSTGYGYSSNEPDESEKEIPSKRREGEPVKKSRSLQAIEAALYNPILDIKDFRAGRNVLLNISGHNLKMIEVNEIANYLKEKISEDANIILGTNNIVPEEEQDNLDFIKVTVVITGLEKAALQAEEKPKKNTLLSWFKENW